MSSRKGDVEKARYWQRTISEAARSGISIREFCRRHRLRESQPVYSAPQAVRSTGSCGSREMGSRGCGLNFSPSACTSRWRMGLRFWRRTRTHSHRFICGK